MHSYHVVVSAPMFHSWDMNSSEKSKKITWGTPLSTNTSARSLEYGKAKTTTSMLSIEPGVVISPVSSEIEISSSSPYFPSAHKAIVI